MRVFLFREEKATGTGWQIRPVPWANPDEPLSPRYLPMSTEALIWMVDNRAALYDSALSPQHNVLAWTDQIGRWPEPFEANVQTVAELDFDDDVPF